MNEIVWSDIVVQLITFAILILTIVLIVLAFRETIKRSKQIDNMPIIYIVIDIALILLLWFVLDFIGVNISYVVPNLMEWATKFILPWIVLYWLIRLIKSFEKK
ncbi:hypothetical protein [Halobacillus naozhouensis]|uniref:Uncharacterized protein n=1 Tax=Halobacillus naozhouensis TaxID=554880 RepID=A0ABY8IV11_9BACI|nr:hypothetical protein [Halobacillus naozhouensis]WFT73642.1 hypothetical protein P9989_14850 [Halobacillus naozhouensis]WFT74185.1 hypothetical protein P9989_17745 [Halobacillus naozhouensis]